MSRTISIATLVEDVTIDLWGHLYKRATVTRVRSRQLREAEEQLETIERDEAVKTVERAERENPALTDEDREVADDLSDRFIDALGAIFDAVLEPVPANGETATRPPSAVVKEKWEGEEVGRDQLLRLLTAMREAGEEEDPTPPSQPAS